jgi:hypothetical protein
MSIMGPSEKKIIRVTGAVFALFILMTVSLVALVKVKEIQRNKIDGPVNN